MFAVFYLDYFWATSIMGSSISLEASNMAISALLIKATDRCNLKCSYCYLSRKNSGDMSKRTIGNLRKLVKYVIAYNKGRPLSMHLSGGEITLLPIEKIEFLFSSLTTDGSRLHMNTNGTLFSDRHAKLCKKYDVSVSLSLDGHHQLHDKQRSNTFDAVSNTFKICRAKKIPHGSIAVLTNESEKCIKDIYDFFKLNKIDIKLNPAQPYVSPDSWKNSMIYIVDSLFKDDFPFHESTLDYIINYLTGKTHVHKDCAYSDCFRNFLSINQNGDVTACERFFGLTDSKSYIFANINIDTPRDIIFNSKRTELLNKLYARKERCFNCKWYELCGSGCSNAPILYKGSLTATDPFCKAKQKLFAHIKNRLRKCRYNAI